jgi:probable phosphoglycerate mutase
MQDKTLLYLIRHGQTDYNRKGQLQGRGIDAPLDAIGKAQSEAVARHLKTEAIDVVVSSSLLRARSTAEIISKGLKVPFHGQYPELDEMDFGNAEGHFVHQMDAQLNTIYEKWGQGLVDSAFDAGESPLDVLERAHRRMMSILNEHAGKRIVAVVHGRLIRILLSDWLGLGLHRMNEIQHANASINKIEWNGKVFSPVLLNYTDHLNQEALTSFSTL